MNLTGRETSPYGWGRILWLGLAVLSFDAAIGPVAFALGFGVDFFGVLLTIDFFVIAIADSSETWILDYFCLGFGTRCAKSQLFFQLAHNVHLRKPLDCEFGGRGEEFIFHR